MTGGVSVATTSGATSSAGGSGSDQVPLPPPQALHLPVHLERVLILLVQVLEVSLERLQQQILALQLVPPHSRRIGWGSLRWPFGGPVGGPDGGPLEAQMGHRLGALEEVLKEGLLVLMVGPKVQVDRWTRWAR